MKADNSMELDNDDMVDDEVESKPKKKAKKKSSKRGRPKKSGPTVVVATRIPTEISDGLEEIADFDVHESFKQFLIEKVLKNKVCPTCGQPLKGHKS